MRTSPYLWFQGNCREAMIFYAEVFQTDPPQFMMASDLPPEDQEAMGEVPEGAVMNAGIRRGDFILSASDGWGDDATAMAGHHVHLECGSVAEADRIWEALETGGTVGMPYGQTFWAQRFGSLTDRFGTRWMVSFEGGGH